MKTFRVQALGGLDVVVDADSAWVAQAWYVAAGWVGVVACEV